MPFRIPLFPSYDSDSEFAGFLVYDSHETQLYRETEAVISLLGIYGLIGCLMVP